MMSDGQVPPLLGDGKGTYKIWLVGNSGCGKSTVGAWLADLLQVPLIPLDTLFWKPGWGSTPDDEFRQKITSAMSQSERGWVMEGAFDRVVSPILLDTATDIIWLDTPLALTFYRILIRTLLRLFSLRPPCSPGCPESWSDALSTKGILWWCLTNHSVAQRKQQARMRELDVNIGGKMRRIGGWGSELNSWKEAVAEMIQSQ